jgi:hypothetical protein
MSALWTPAYATGKRQWLDASDSATLTLSGSNITAWADKSGNGYNLTQGTAANQPTKASAIFNGLDVVRFNDVSDFMSFSMGTTTLSNCFIVYKTTKSSYIHFVNPTTNAYLAAFNSAETTSTTIWDPVWGTPIPYVDGVQQTWTYRSQPQIALNNRVALLEWVGVNLTTGPNFELCGYSTSDATWGFTGDIAEIIWVDGTLDAAKRQLFEGYLAHKWGFTSSLNVAHPYKTAAPVLSSVSGYVRDKNNQPAIRKIVVLDEATNAILSVSNSLADGSFTVNLATTLPVSIIVSGEADRNSQIFSGVIPV